jgi:hypothetical protein
MPMLIPPAIGRSIPPLYATDDTPAAEQIVHVKLFALNSTATWLVTEYDPINGVCFGYADLYGQGAAGGAEWGYFSLAELAALKWNGIPRVERDLHFTPRPFAQCVDESRRIIA